MAAQAAKNIVAEAREADSAATPLLAQYLSIKAQHPDCLLFFRLGDFYEMFFEDALAASRALDIALTRRGQHQGRDVPMCGVPAHAYENYLSRLIRKGFRVAICEQTEDPAEAKKRGGKAIVSREVVRVVTPGTVTEESLLDSRAANHLACLTAAGGEMALAWMDLGEGRPRVRSLDSNGSNLGMALAEISPSEIILPERLFARAEVSENLGAWKDCAAPQPDSRFDAANAIARLKRSYGVDDLASFGDFSRAEAAALGALLDYVSLTQKRDVSRLSPPMAAQNAGIMAIDPATRRNLEITRTLEGERQGSLLHAIDRTVTGTGARMLAARLAAPSTCPSAIAIRLDAIDFMLRDKALREKIRRLLAGTPDMERALARLSLGRGGPRDLAAVRDALARAEEAKGLTLSAMLSARESGHAAAEEIASAAAALEGQEDLRDELARALAPDLPLLTRDGGFIAAMWSPQLDELVALRDDGRRVIAGLQQKYARESGVDNLKIRHNQVIGYHIETTPAHADKLLSRKDLFIHRQSLAGAARFTTVELGEMERKISEAAGRALALELEFFAQLAAAVMERLDDLRRVSEALATLDVAAGLAELAETESYVRPVVDSTLDFHVKGGRHPVVEQALRKDGQGGFIGNDCDQDPSQRLWLITGPNMAGKSTFLRQNALIALMAQAGCFVPAKSARIGVVDKLFSRVGASDDLARGRSTFMVEMVETAAILNQAGERSLVILDEIGRGTATYDGLSIAWATVEHLHEANRCRTLFATHYHELTALAARLPALRLATMKIREWKGGIVFLHEVGEGAADRSYGIHVARMAGLPPAVTSRAEDVLAELEGEREGGAAGGKAGLADLPLFSATGVKPSGLEMPQETAAAIESLKAVNPDNLTPREALDALYRLKELLRKK